MLLFGCGPARCHPTPTSTPPTTGDIAAEAEILLLLGHHPHLTRFYGQCQDDADPENIILITEFAPLGGLDTHLEKEAGRITFVRTPPHHIWTHACRPSSSRSSFLPTPCAPVLLCVAAVCAAAAEFERPRSTGDMRIYCAVSLGRNLPTSPNAQRLTLLPCRAPCACPAGTQAGHDAAGCERDACPHRVGISPPRPGHAQHPPVCLQPQKRCGDDGENHRLWADSADAERNSPPRGRVGDTLVLIY